LAEEIPPRCEAEHAVTITNANLVRAQELDDSIKKVMKFYERFFQPHRFIDADNVILPKRLPGCKDSNNRDARDVATRAGEAARASIRDDLRNGMLA
jgi:hypothetical protein